MRIEADLLIKGNLRKFYTKLNDLQDLVYTKAKWQYLRDNLELTLSAWTDAQLDRALTGDGFLGTNENFNCYVG